MYSVWLHMLKILIALVGGFLQRRIVDLSIQVSEAELRCKVIGSEVKVKSPLHLGNLVP
jgi:hypothetical protein